MTRTYSRRQRQAMDGLGDLLDSFEYLIWDMPNLDETFTQYRARLAAWEVALLTDNSGKSWSGRGWVFKATSLPDPILGETFSHYYSRLSTDQRALLPTPPPLGTNIWSGTQWIVAGMPTASAGLPWGTIALIGGAILIAGLLVKGMRD